VPIANLSPLLYFAAPALRIHPATETVLRYFSREIEWSLIAIGEDWRRSLDVIWRKRGGGIQPA
jgi:hypothetical protein